MAIDHPALKHAMDLARGGPEEITKLGLLVGDVLRYELQKRKESVEEAICTGHSSVNAVYGNYLRLVHCPWIRSQFPRTLEVEDLNSWIQRLTGKAPPEKVPSPELRDHPPSERWGMHRLVRPLRSLSLVVLPFGAIHHGLRMLYFGLVYGCPFPLL